MSTPNPKAVFGNRKAPVIPAPPVHTPVVVAQVQPIEPGQIVRPGYVDAIETSIHDGVVKAKHLQKGQRVRAYLHGKPQGGERIVQNVTRVPDTDGALVEIEWASGHPTSQHKAAYRWHDASLVGTSVDRIVKQPALIAYQEV